MVLEDLRIILSRPQEGGNVGAVCRAMKNMGLSRLRIVSPAQTLEEELIRARAVHGGDIWEGAQFFDTLPQAAGDCAVVVGTTRRRGHRRKSLSLSPEALAVYLHDQPGPGALVFGNERTGLEAEELDFCNLASHIPAAESFPSLNLSHAVQVYAYQLFRVLGSRKGAEEERVSMDQSGIALLVRELTDFLGFLGFYKQPGRLEQERFFRDIFSRAGLSIREGRYMGELFAKAARLGQNLKG